MTSSLVGTASPAIENNVPAGTHGSGRRTGHVDPGPDSDCLAVDLRTAAGKMAGFPGFLRSGDVARREMGEAHLVADRTGYQDSDRA